MHQLRLVSIGILLSFTAMAAVNPPTSRSGKTCGCAGTAVLVDVTGILNAGDDCSTYSQFDTTNDHGVVTGEPTTPASMTLGDPTNTNNCSDLGTGVADGCYSTASGWYKGEQVAHLSGNNSRDMRIFADWQIPSATQHPGTKWTTLSFLQMGSSSSTYHACYADSVSNTAVYCKFCAN